ncbi:DNA breaking-rejoining enzyme [Mycena haematopus]|nr:DNA breaking-rejoining enzyme [Mycena haematopus]KAJ7226372.1 DNA breaking-rejoining enzyme [Mycena haematopus]
MAKFATFLIDEKLIHPGDQVFTSQPHTDTPWWICFWIMSNCDVIDVAGNPIPSSQEVPTYAHAQKMRAAMTYAFGRVHRLGSTPWQESSSTGHMLGNPSVSEIVSSYMVSLRRRKVKAGETQISSRALTPEIIRQIYDHNNSGGRCIVQPLGTRSPKEWCTARTRLLLHAALTIAFACLLRFEEALRIQMSDIEFRRAENGKRTVVLTLRSRKTSQFGGIKPFVLHMLPLHEAHLCPVRSLCRWIAVIPHRSGHLFRTVNKNGQVSSTNKLMTTSAFLQILRNNLLDIEIDPAPYGTHSVRRGGVQWLLLFKRAGLRQICEWGGWSTDFNSSSLLRYIISISDDIQLSREDFLDPDRPPQLHCYACGRTCHCY